MRQNRRGRILCLALALCGAVLPLRAQENYVRTFIPLQNVPTNGASESNSLVSTTFLDAAGRRVQTVIENVSPTGKDVADRVVYDSIGRIAQVWRNLPFTNSTSEPSMIPLHDFENSSYAEGNHLDYTYEPSALHRPISTNSVHTPGRNVSTEYICAVPTDIYRFTFAGIGSIQNVGLFPNALHGVKRTDEDGNTETIYTDTQGRTLLERRGHTGQSDVLDTYYVYDDFGCLACVLPPAAVQQTRNVGTYDVQTCEALQQFAYFYRYDARNNRVGVKMPGIDWCYTIYDAGGRPVLSQSPNQRSKGEWCFFRYDGLGRIILKGTVTNSASWETLTAQYSNICLRDVFAGTGTFGYTDSISLGTSENVLEAFYYDNYGFLTLAPFSSLAGTDISASTRTRGLCTGKYTAALSGSSAHEASVFLYDERGRLVASRADNHVTGVRTSRTSTLDYLGNPLTTDVSYACSTDSIAEHFTYTYDRLGRGTSATLDVHLAGTQNPDGYDAHYDLWTATYDERGHLSQLAAFGNREVTTYSYHNDGRLHQLQGTHFDQTLYYHNGYATQRYYNGRISMLRNAMGQDIRFSEITYDDFGRMNHSSVTSPQQVFEESFQYDAMGNVTQLYRAQDGYTLNDMDITFSGNRIASVCDYADESPLTNNFLHTPWSNDGNAYLYDANGNETRNMSHNVSHVKYNLLNLPDSVIFADGNMLSFVYMADGRRVGTDSHTGSTPLVLPGIGGHGGPQVQTWEHYDGDVTASPTGFTRLEIPGGYLTFGREFCEFTPSQGGGLSFDGEWTRSLSSHYYVTDYLGSVVAVCSGETGAVEQSLEYMPSGAIFSATNYGAQPYKFCGKELLTMHGWDMYDSFARYQYARLPRFSTMDPLAEWDYATSPYAYCQNDFVNLADPWGLFPTWEEAYKASLDHPGSFVGQDWITGNYFYSYRLDSDDLVLAHREFGIMGNPDIFGRPHIGYSSYLDPQYNLGYGSGVGGGRRKVDYGLITKPIEITSTIGDSYYTIKSRLEYNEELGTWRGKNGKTYHGLTGKGPNQHTGSRAAAKDRAKVFHTKGNRFAKWGKRMMFGGVAYDFYEGKYYKAFARLITNYAIGTTKGIPYVGPVVFAGLATSEVFWGEEFYDWVQESLE